MRMAPPESSLTPEPSPKGPIIKYIFTTELQLMMHGLGDASNPFIESAQLIERILTQQLHMIAVHLAETAEARNSGVISYEDIMFLMRRNKVKLQRLLHCLSVKQFRSHIFKSDTAAAEPVIPTQFSLTNKCHEFLANLLQPGEFQDFLNNPVPDPIKHQRMLRSDHTSKVLSEKRYERFTEARAASFIARGTMPKFKEWLGTEVFGELKPNPHALDILAILSKEIVAEMVDSALFARRDRTADPNKPFAKVVFPPAIIDSGRENQIESPDSGSTSKLPNNKGLKKTEDHLPYTNPALTPYEYQEAYRRLMTRIGPLNPFAALAQESKIICF